MRVSSTAYRCKLGFGCNENTGIVRWIAYGSAPTAALLPSETASYPAFNECAILARRLRRGLVVKQVAHLTAATSRFKVHRRGKLPLCDISENRGPTKTNLLDHFREPQQPLRVRCAFDARSRCFSASQASRARPLSILEASCFLVSRRRISDTAHSRSCMIFPIVRVPGSRVIRSSISSGMHFSS